MSGALEAAGKIATGSAWARVAERRAGEGYGEVAHGTCLNCGTVLTGRYCHACGQSSHVHKTLMSIVHDLLHGVFHFEGKIWRTIPMLVLHPGQLTRRYIDGERARFVSPLALFLFTVFLLFATFSLVTPSDLAKGFSDGLASSTAQLDRSRAQTAQAIAVSSAERARLVTVGQATASIDRRLARLRDDAAAMDTVKQRLQASGSGGIDVHSSLPWLDQRLRTARANPGLAIYKVQSAAYKFSWVLIFLSTPLVALLFLWRRRFGLYDHATFVTYSISFMSMLVIVLELASFAGLPDALLILLVLLVPPAHMFAQLRGTYGIGVFGASWRTTVMLGLATLTLMLFVVGVVAFEVGH